MRAAIDELDGSLPIAPVWRTKTNNDFMDIAAPQWVEPPKISQPNSSPGLKRVDLAKGSPKSTPSSANKQYISTEYISRLADISLFKKSPSQSEVKQSPTNNIEDQQINHSSHVQTLSIGMGIKIPSKFEFAWSSLLRTEKVREVSELPKADSEAARLGIEQDTRSSNKFKQFGVSSLGSYVPWLGVQGRSKMPAAESASPGKALRIEDLIKAFEPTQADADYSNDTHSTTDSANSVPDDASTCSGQPGRGRRRGPAALSPVSSIEASSVSSVRIGSYYEEALAAVERVGFQKFSAALNTLKSNDCDNQNVGESCHVHPNAISNVLTSKVGMTDQEASAVLRAAEDLNLLERNGEPNTPPPIQSSKFFPHHGEATSTPPAKPRAGAARTPGALIEAASVHGLLLSSAWDIKRDLARKLVSDDMLFGSHRLRKTASVLASPPPVATDRLAGSRRLAGVARIWLGGRGDDDSATSPSAAIASDVTPMQADSASGEVAAAMSDANKSTAESESELRGGPSAAAAASATAPTAARQGADGKGEIDVAVSEKESEVMTSETATVSSET